MALVGDWQELERSLPEGWQEARLRFTIDETAQIERAAALLAPLQPLRAGPDVITLRVARGGGGPSPEALRRALSRLEAERIHGRLALVSHEDRPLAPPAAPPPRLPESWDAALATLPADWSDLLGEIELASSDYVERAALHLAPINPRRIGTTLCLQFRSASRFGYGASAGMVRRCLERCDADGIRGRVEVLRALSDTHPVGTQGPVWQIDGRMV
jgi:hypothetical protein